MPRFRAQLATLVDRAPDGDEWLHEIKYDGYRIGCTIDAGTIQLASRRGQNWTAAFPEVTRALEALRLDSALLDGEVAVLLPDGRTSFQALQNATRSQRRGGTLVYFLFDLLYLDGRDLTRLSLLERKERLSTLLTRAAPTPGQVLRFSEHFVGHGPNVLAEACRLGVEGVVSKRGDLPYRAGRGHGWLKSKCLLRQELVVGGFTEPEGERRGFGALLVGYYDEGALCFAGKVGTGPGFTATYLSRVRRELEQLEQTRCPFTPRPPGALGKHAHWVRPERVVEVTFSEWTEGGAVRHASLQGFREDKDPHEVRRERERRPADLDRPSLKRASETRKLAEQRGAPRKRS